MISAIEGIPLSWTPAPEFCAGPGAAVLVLGVGNWLMGDEGVGIHAIRELEHRNFPPGVRLLDGGTGGVNLLQEIEEARHVVMIDATRDGRPAGSVTLLEPERVGDLPRGLGAHDFGLKDLFAAAALLGKLPKIHLYTISVEELHPMCIELSAAVAAALAEVVPAAHALGCRLADESR